MAWLVVLIGGELFYQVIRRAALATESPHLVPGMVLVGTLIVPVAFVTFLWGLEGHHEVTSSMAMVVALGGGCVALSLAATLEQIALDHGSLSASGVAAIEEATKLAVIAASLAWLVRASPRNGLTIGAACGAGFAVVETLGYAFVDYVHSGGGMVALDDDLLSRSLFAPATHLAWAGLNGWALGFAASRRRRFSGVVAVVLTYVTTAALHAAWDADPGPAVYLVITVAGLTLLVACLRASASPRRDSGDDAATATSRPGHGASVAERAG